MPRPTVTLIAAVSDDGFISRDRGVPWDLPTDRTHFRRCTAGKWLFLGRTTYEEMTGWFKDHKPLVWTRDESYQPVVGQRVASIEEAIDLVGADELVVVGGGQAFAAAMPVATQLNLTRVHARLSTGVPFPFIDPKVWVETEHRDYSGDGIPLTFSVMMRRSS